MSAQDTIELSALGAGFLLLTLGVWVLHLQVFRRNPTLACRAVIILWGLGSLGALAVAAVKLGQPFLPHIIWLCVLAPIAGLFHWFESWIAHDMAFRLLAEMRVALFKKLDRLAPALSLIHI